MYWPSDSPDLKPSDFFLWGFVKDTVFVPSVPANFQELHDRITEAVALIDCDMLTHVCEVNWIIGYTCAVSAKVDTLSS